MGRELLSRQGVNFPETYKMKYAILLGLLLVIHWCSAQRQEDDVSSLDLDLGQSLVGPEDRHELAARADALVSPTTDEERDFLIGKRSPRRPRRRKPRLS